MACRLQLLASGICFRTIKGRVYLNDLEQFR